MDAVTGQSYSGRRKYKFEFRNYDVFNTCYVDLLIKNGVAVDSQSCHVRRAHVYRDFPDGTIYSAYLTETDVENRKNSYRKIQVLRSDASTRCWLFQTYGGIGAATYMYNETEMSLNEAVKEFKAIFEEWTGNSWENRNNFQNIRGKMNLLEIVYTPNVVQVDDEVTSRLTEPVHKMTKEMINASQWVFVLPQIQTRDSRKWPMGKLSEKNIEKAMEVLGQLLDCVAERKPNEIDEETMYRCCNLYYSLVPRASELGCCLKPLNTAKAIMLEYEFLDTLPKNLRTFSLIDTRYANLSTKLRFVDPSNESIYRTLKICLQRTGNVKVIEVFELNRHGEDQGFSVFEKYENRKLLWHGSPLSNLERILSKGLSIKGVARFGLFGTGIYFSDMVAKSINYCRVQKGVGYLLLCEVALGKMELVKQHSASNNWKKKRPATGYDSVLACGRRVPDPKDDITLENGSTLSLGRGILPKHQVASSALGIPYNEYIVYDEAQIKMRYLVKFKYQSRR